MPVSPARAALPDSDPTPAHCRPYAFHGVDLAVRGGHAVGACPFCGRAGKFSIAVDTGLWRCLVCATGTAAGGGNPLVFIRHLHAAAVSGTPTGFHRAVAADRRLLHPETCVAWGVACAADGAWLVPGYGPDGRLDQLYRRTRVLDGGAWVWRLLPTPGVWPDGKAHALHLSTFDPKRSAVVVCEGVWDGMVVWELGREAWGDANIVAVPGCNVWRDEWTALCCGKQVTLLYDSDHPRSAPGSAHVSRAGYDGVVRVAKRLSGQAASVRWLRWGPDGYDPTRPSGWDVRDYLTGGG